MILIDPYGRKVTGLRVAITSRCDLRCAYCHREGQGSVPRDLSQDLAVSLARAARDLGMRSFKITGGEPLLHPEIPEILGLVPPELDVSLTTNGILLKSMASNLADSGLDRVNVSLDSLRESRYRSITGAREGDLDRVLKGIDASLESGLSPVKLNMVVLKENLDEIGDMIHLARRKGIILQLIELLDLGRTSRGGDMEALEKELSSRADRVVVRDMHRRRKYFLDGAEVEVVRPMDNTEFCAHCTRLRVTSDGQLKPCLLRQDNLVPLKSSQDEDIKASIIEAVSKREPYFQRRSGVVEDTVKIRCRSR